MSNFKFIIPCYNANKNLPSLISSLINQDDSDWEAFFIDDISDEKIPELNKTDSRLNVIYNQEKKYALKNINDTIKQNCSDDDIIAIIDGDDSLCNNKTVSLLKKEYTNQEIDVVWTAHRWDINNMNISKDMPKNIDPYQYPWCASHLRTFRAKLFNSVPESNFKDHKGEWFQRGYDQALMLPLLHLAKDFKFLNEVCYLYKINSVSVNDRDWAEKKQLQTVNFVRSRGFLDK